METIYKVLENCEVKKVGERQYEFTASTADIDRDGEVIDVEGWDLKNFKKNPVIMFAHDYRTLPIGKATKIGIKDGKLMDVVEFPPEGTYEFADIVQRLVDTGYLKTQSVGFIPKKWEDGDFDDDSKDSKKPRRTYTKQELLEISIVPIPSNPNALMNAVKEGVITTKQFKTITEGEPEIIEDKITKPEETDDFIRIPVRTCEVTATIDISKKEGISALYCGKEKQVRTYLFRKDKGWTMAKAKEWVKEHDGKSFEPHEVSQSEIRDELDYIDTLISKGGLSKETAFDAVDVAIRTMARAWHYHQWESITLGENLTGETEPIIFKRISGSDIPVEDNGDDLSTQNGDDLSQPPNTTISFQEIQESLKRISNNGGKTC